MPNQPCHAYDDVDPGIVWRVISNRLPDLKADITAALHRLQRGGDD
jgi:uncharacterized protein with HEPN domain